MSPVGPDQQITERLGCATHFAISRDRGAWRRSFDGATAALLVLGFFAACGGSQPTQVLSGGQPLDGDVLIISEHVRASWAGQTWSGSPARLASNDVTPEGPECGGDYLVGHEIIRNPTHLAGLDQHEAEHVLVTVRGWSASGGCSNDGDWVVSRVGHGGVLLFDGPADAMTPGEVLSRGGRVVTMRGWTVEAGDWIVGNDPIVAVLEPASHIAAVACVQSDGRGAAERLAEALVYAELGSPSTAARAAGDTDILVALHGGPLRPLLEGTEQQIPSGCLTSPVFRVALLATMRPLSSGDDSLSAPEATLLALSAFEASEWMAAGDAIDHALEASPGYAPALMLRGRIEEEVNVNLAAAADAFAAAAQDEHLEAIARFRLGVLQEDLGDSGAAVNSYAAAAAADQRYAPPVNALGFLAFEDGRLGEARTHFEEALDRDPSFAQAANNLGFIAEVADGDPTEAARWYERSIEADPNSAAAHVNLAAVAIRYLGRVEEGEELLRTALALDPRNEDALQALDGVLARPPAVSETLAGTWSGVGPSGAAFTATFTADGSFGLVTRHPGLEPVAVRVPSGETAAHRSQRLYRAEDDTWMVELVSESELHLYRPGTPVSRAVLTRHHGGMARSL